jgi:hypothetical protein
VTPFPRDVPAVAGYNAPPLIYSVPPPLETFFVNKRKTSLTTGKILKKTTNYLCLACFAASCFAALTAEPVNQGVWTWRKTRRDSGAQRAKKSVTNHVAGGCCDKPLHISCFPVLP